MKTLSLQGRHVLVTGAAGGIGAALSRCLLREGVGRLLLVDRDLAGLRRLKQELETAPAPPEVTVFDVDLATREALIGLAERLRDQRLDVLVNNAGVAPGGAFGAMDFGAIELVLETNLRATVFLTHQLLPNLLQSDRAAIVNIASGAGLLAPGGMVAYAASKFGVVGFSEGLRAELRGRGVGVTVVCPPFVRTGIVRNSVPAGRVLSDAEADRVKRLDALVQGRGLRAEVVAARIVRALRKNQGRVVLGGFPRFLLGTRFFLPRLADWLNHLNFRKMEREGLL
jgi:short-subunit dehydrogenase